MHYAAIASQSQCMRPRACFKQVSFFEIPKLLENSRPTACYFQWNSWKLLDQFQNFSKHEVIKDFTCCNSRLLFGVMTFNQPRKCILAARNRLHHRQKTSRPILFLREIFLFFDLDCQNLATLGFDNCPISEKENLSQKKKFRPRTFLPLSNLFLLTKNIYS